MIIDDTSQLATQFQKSGLEESVAGVNILVDGEVVDTVSPDMLTDSPVGLTYEGKIEDLDVSIDAENIISAEVVFTPESNLGTTKVDHTVTAGEGETTDGEGNPIDESGNGDGDQDQYPFEKMRNGGNSDDCITLGYVDRGANGGAGDDLLDSGAGNDSLYGGNNNDTLIAGAGDDTIFGGNGSHVFVLQSRIGTDLIEDFNDGVDKFALEAELNYDDLSFSNNNAGTATIIQNTTNDNQILAIISNVSADAITVDDFITI